MRNVYSNLNTLDEISFIGGTYYILEFNVFDENGDPIDISSATPTWLLCYYGQPDYAVVAKSGSITGTNTFEVIIDTADTENLSGKFLQQPTITDFDGTSYIPAQGVVTILPKINN